MILGGETTTANEESPDSKTEGTNEEQTARVTDGGNGGNHTIQFVCEICYEYNNRFHELLQELKTTISF